jgi:predicted  nucleic acid-binding Zn-ribbon protein
MQRVNVMKTVVHDIVRRLLELQALEERREEFKRNREKRAEVQALIESLRANLPAAMLISHDRMCNKDKASVAEVRRGICTGCHLALAVGNVALLRRGEMRQCGNCGRFLYLVEDEQETSGAPGSKRTATTKKSVSSP